MWLWMLVVLEVLLVLLHHCRVHLDAGLHVVVVCPQLLCPEHVNGGESDEIEPFSEGIRPSQGILTSHLPLPLHSTAQ